MFRFGFATSLIAVCFCFWCDNGHAQENRVASFESGAEPTTLQNRLAALELEVRQLRSIQSTTSDAPSFEGDALSCGGCDQPQFLIGGEVVFVSPSSTTGLGPSGSAFFGTSEILPSWRGWMEFKQTGGVGIRGKFWSFDQLVQSDFGAFSYGLDTSVSDIEMTYQTVTTSQWELLVSGGIRHVNFHEDRSFVSTSFIDSDLTGLVVGGEVARELTRGIHGYGIVRSASVFGSTTGEVPPGNVKILDNTQSWMWESQLGLEMRRKLQNGDIRLRLGVEAQQWDDITLKQLSGSISIRESIGFYGFVAGLTFTR